MLDRAVAETGPGESIVIYADPIRWMEQTFSTVIALGYRPMDANRMARAVDDGAKTSEEIIRGALKSVAVP